MPLKDIVQAYVADLHPWGISSFTSNLIDASGEKHAFIFQIPKSGSITHIGFRTVAVATPQTLRVGLETLSAGVPSGSQYGGSAVGTQAAPAADTYYEVALATPATAVRGDFVAIVVQFDGTIGSANIAGGSGTGNHDFPYTALFTASWAKNFQVGVHSIKYSDGTYGNILAYPAASVSEITFNSGSTPDERALKFKLAFPATLAGVYSRWGSDVGSTFDIVLYDSNGTTALSTQSVVMANLKGSGDNFKKFLFPQAVALKANTFYRLAFKPTNTTNCQLYQFTVNTAGMLDTFAGGQNFHLSTRTDAGAWTDTTTTRPHTGLILERFHDGQVSDYISL